MKYRLFLIHFILFCGLASSQQQDSTNVYKEINRANALIKTQPTQASEIVKDVLAKAIRTNNERATAYAYNTLGAIHYHLNAFEEAVDYYNKSLTLFEIIEDPSGSYNTLKYLTASLDALNEYDKAEKYYKRFLNLATENNNEKDVLLSYINLGRLNYNQAKYDKALKYFNKVLVLYEEKKDKTGVAETKIWIGMVNEKLGNPKVAVDNYYQSNKIALENDDLEIVNQSSNSLGNYLNSTHSNGEAIEVQKKALEYNTKKNNRRGELDNVQQIAKYQLDDHNPEDALPYIKQSIDISKELGDVEALKDANLLLSKAYEQQGEYDSALVEYKKYISLVDSMRGIKAEDDMESLKLSKDLKNKVTELEQLKVELDAKAQDMSLLQKDYDLLDKELLLEKNQKEAKVKQAWTIIVSLICLLIVGVIASFLILRSSRENKRINQLLALKNLRSQMNPHFIFNSLNSVNSFIASNDERSANKYLSEFARLMRAVMENSKYDFVPLNTELDILRMYLDLEHLRFKNQFNYVFEVDPEIDIDHFRIPPMLIQPYIENAIWHGLRYKQNMGFLKVEFIKENNAIKVIIEDNGIGRKQSQEIKTHNQKKNNSTGMKNIENRLTIINQMLSTDLGVDIIDLEEEGVSKGTRVEIRIPYNINKQAA